MTLGKDKWAPETGLIGLVEMFDDEENRVYSRILQDSIFYLKIHINIM